MMASLAHLLAKVFVTGQACVALRAVSHSSFPSNPFFFSRSEFEKEGKRCDIEFIVLTFYYYYYYTAVMVDVMIAACC